MVFALGFSEEPALVPAEPDLYDESTYLKAGDIIEWKTSVSNSMTHDILMATFLVIFTCEPVKSCRISIQDHGD